MSSEIDLGAAFTPWPRRIHRRFCNSRRHDPRGCLGLDAAASAGAVRKRYLHLALRLHPDKAKHPQAPEAFTAIEAAWQKLRPAA